MVTKQGPKQKECVVCGKRFRKKGNESAARFRARRGCGRSCARKARPQKVASFPAAEVSMETKVREAVLALRQFVARVLIK